MDGVRKLLHERLREMSDELNVLVLGDVRIALYAHEAEALADEIERYYIPRPRFEDGEPVQWGDCVEDLEVPITALTIHDDGSGAVGDWSVNDTDWVGFSIPDGNYLKRQQPEPDSLEKLRDDMSKIVAYGGEYVGCCTLKELQQFNDRLSALIERGER